MIRLNPPPIALWILEHLTPPECEDALAGDLLEEFRGGRGNAWFWRQVLAEWVCSWARYFGRRRSMLLFALLWSAMAPAWTVVIDRVERGVQTLGQGFDSPLSTLSTLMLWLSLQLVFLWAGALIYFAWVSRQPRPRGAVLRACGVAAGLFLPLYFATCILMNLFAWPGLQIDRSAMTPMSEVVDLRGWALAIRVPYLLTLLCAVWRAVPQLAETPRLATEGPRTEWGEQTIALPNGRPIARPADPSTVSRFFAFVVIAGLLNALIAGNLLCRLPDSHAPTIEALMLRAAAYVLLGAAAGIMGAWVYWNNPASPFREDAPMPFSLFALVCAAGWLWVPAMVIFAEQFSGISALVAAIGAVLLGAGLRSATLLVSAPEQPGFVDRGEIFAESLYEAPGDAHGYFIALCLYAGGWALTIRSNMTAAALLGSATFWFAWVRTGGPSGGGIVEVRREYWRAAVRLTCVATPAVLVTAWALMDGVERRNHGLAVRPDGGAGELSAHKGASFGIGGYESVILWPYPTKKQILAPVKLEESLLAPGTTQPLVVKFDGPYWYVQPPDERPGPAAHQALGTPLKVGIESGNKLPLIMEAHQRLGGLIRLARCREIEVEVVNQDNRSGLIAMGLRLTNSAVPEANSGSNSVQIESQPLASTELVQFRDKSTPVSEKLRFAVPSRAKIRAFNEITVVLSRDAAHAKLGPRVAITQFEMLPR